MKTGNIRNKILTLPQLQKQINQWRFLGKTIAFTNGCFDIIHAGHIASLIEAAKHGSILLVGLNSDASVRKLKGEGRPLNDEQSRALVLAAITVVDGIVIFEEETPKELIAFIKPDVLVKGGDYKIEDIAGADEVIANGGKVIINPLLPGYSTTATINKLLNVKN
ncbi:MAG: D-glycero-beta-D-manno-heptose 1-phosphate adenylyltransferase [Chitinophagaceae bacterium]|nr:D-glycero-beta-D-manno-heptose 1-phosphate adenylyltransferase [Chitinophagaceae bacterium]